MTQLLARVRARITYANLTATLALFVALGGTSYAALTLPRNSVGSSQIRANAVGPSELRSRAVGSSELRDRSIKLGDISTSARASLRGAQGPTGPAGAAAVTYRAAVTSGGGSVRGNAIDAGHTAGTNEYHVVFAPNVNVSGCIYNATLAAVQNGPTLEQPPAGRITVADGPDARTVTVKTYEANGNPVEAPFHLIVAC
jgi:hypothetical protein